MSLKYSRSINFANIRLSNPIAFDSAIDIRNDKALRKRLQCRGFPFSSFANTDDICFDNIKESFAFSAKSGSLVFINSKDKSKSIKFVFFSSIIICLIL